MRTTGLPTAISRVRRRMPPTGSFHSATAASEQPGYDLIRSFGRPEQRDYEIGRVVVTFALDDRGAIRDIEVLSARDPASAWAGIDAVLSAKIQENRLAERRSSDPGGFPIALCFTQNYDPYEPGLPSDGTIRGREIGGEGR